ncbi:hypothetical protein ACWC5I_46605, partial [Kitasatospora sp. NPDC001574]
MTADPGDSGTTARPATRVPNGLATGVPDDAEQTVLDLLAAGLTPAAIAARHGVYAREVNHLIKVLRDRYGVRTTCGLLARHFADPDHRARLRGPVPARAGGLTALQGRLLRLLA